MNALIAKSPPKRLRVPGVLAWAALVMLSPAYAHHDDIPKAAPHSTARKLEAVAKLSREGVTVSGVSSGAFFAHQFHIAYSGLLVGAGLVAGGPFGCVESIPDPYRAFWGSRLPRVAAATVACTHYFGSSYFGLRPAAPKASDSIRLIQEAWSERAIDDPANLRSHRVWLFRGARDEIVPEAVNNALKELYRDLGVEGARLAEGPIGAAREANHGMPVTQFAGASKFPIRDCGQHAPPFIVQCGYEAAEQLLRHLYPDNFKTASDDSHRDGTLLPFDQTEFFNLRDERVILHKTGYAYVPQTCAAQACRLHVAFHGCKQDLDSIHDDFIRDAGYNRWAAANSIVVLYPQAASSQQNPNACWDFWGYSGLPYSDQRGAQMRAVKGMVDRMLGIVP